MHILYIHMNNTHLMCSTFLQLSRFTFLHAAISHASGCLPSVNMHPATCLITAACAHCPNRPDNANGEGGTGRTARCATRRNFA